MALRPYQQLAHDAIVRHIRSSREPCLIEAATGAGKSHIIAELAKTIHAMSGGKSVLVLQPSKELTEQNFAKYLETGNRASLFSAAIGTISTKHPVVFGTPLTVKNKLSRFGEKFGLIIIDECHGITPTIITIIDGIRAKNPNVRVVGLTATPFRSETGYIYKIDENDKPVPDFQTKDPYFTKLVYRVTARYLLDLGYLTPVTIGRIGAGHYDTKELTGKTFDKNAVDRAYNGHGRLTAQIVADVIAQSKDRHGVLLFCATVQHAKEAFASLPPELSAYVDGDTDPKERERIVRMFKARKIKYLVNVAVYTTGFDAPHVDVVAMLRLTESPGLLQQIIGRGLRPYEGKEYCTILDHSGNTLRFFDQMEEFLENGRHHLDDGSKKESVKKEKNEEETVRKCPSCFRVHKRAQTCPNCGFEYPRKAAVTHEDGELKQLAMERSTTDEKRQLFAELKGLADNRGWSEGRLANVYRDLVGTWPNAYKYEPAQSPSIATINKVKHLQLKFLKSEAGKAWLSKKAVTA